jgi:YHS domain-containing protein
MTNAPSADTPDQSLTRDILYAVRYYLGGPRRLIALAVILIVGGVALNWGWLVAAGLAPFLIAFLPCAVMCTLGMCMHKMGDADKAANRSVGKAQALTADTVNSHGRDANTPDLVDPVSQRMLPAASAVASVHQGRIYYFEDRANRAAFEAEPEKYLAGSQAIGQQVGSPGKSSEHSHQGHGCCRTTTQA